MDVLKSLANFTRTFCTRNSKTSINDDEDTLETFTTTRLIPLDKNPGIRPTGVREIRQIAIFVKMDIAKKDVQEAAGSSQVCVDQDAGAEATIDTM